MGFFNSLFRKKEKNNSYKESTTIDTSRTAASSSTLHSDMSTSTPPISSPWSSSPYSPTPTVVLDEHFYHCAGVLGKFEYVKQILDRMEKATVKDHMNRNILHHACQWGNVQIVIYGISRGIPINLKDTLGNTPLHYCCGEGYISIVQILLQHPKIKIDVKNKEGITPRRKAYFYGHDDVVMILERYMGNINLFKERLKNQVIDVETNYADYKLSDITLRTQQ